MVHLLRVPVEARTAAAADREALDLEVPDPVARGLAAPVDLEVREALGGRAAVLGDQEAATVSLSARSCGSPMAG